MGRGASRGVVEETTTISFVKQEGAVCCGGPGAKDGRRGNGNGKRERESGVGAIDEVYDLNFSVLL